MDSWSTALLRWLRSHRDEARVRLLRLAAASSAAALLLGLMQRRLALAAAAAPKIQDVPLSLVLDNVEAGRVHSAVLAAGAATFRLKDNSILKATLPALDTQWLLKLLRKHAVEFSAQGPSRWRAALVILLPFGYLGACGYMLWRLTNDQGFNGGRELPAASAGADDDLMVPAVSFADVAGLPRVKAQVAEVVDCLRRPERYARLGARPPRGLLLVGPPGTGKTLLAKAVAAECGVPFLCCSGSEFVEVFVGRGAKRVRTLFDEAARRAPCVVFIDELDAVGGARSGRGGGSEEHEHTLNQLLAAMDGVTSTARVLVMGATNRLKALDAALVRPGRFDRVLTLQLPDETGRRDVLAVHARRAPLEEREGTLRAVAARTAGWSGAELANLANEAAIGAARAGRDAVTRGDFDDALAEYARARAARAAPDTAADLDQFAANFMRGLQQASATAGGSIDDNE